MKRSPRFQVAVPLAVAPLLLLVPLGALKWRADHPPLSAMDRMLRAAFAKAAVVRMNGASFAPEPWLRPGHQHFWATAINDKAILKEIVEALRCGDVPAPTSRIDVNSEPTIVLEAVEFSNAPPYSHSRSFIYWARNERRYLALFVEGPSRSSHQVLCAQVRPRFVPQFEALLARLDEQAEIQAKLHPARVTP